MLMSNCGVHELSSRWTWMQLGRFRNVEETYKAAFTRTGRGQWWQQRRYLFIFISSNDSEQYKTRTKTMKNEKIYTKNK